MAPNVVSALWIAASCLLFSMMNAIAKLLLVAGSVGGLHPLQVTFGRYLFAAAVLAPFAVVHRFRLPSASTAMRYLVRVVSGYLGVVLMFFAIKTLRLSDATAIGFASPFFAIVAAAFILGERPDRRSWLSAVIGFVGVMIITQPTQATFEPAALVALAAAAAMGVEIVGVKWISDVDRAAAVIFFSNALAVPLGAVAAIPVWTWPTLSQWLVLISSGVVAAIGQQCVIRGARLGDASFIAPLFYLSLIFSALLGLIMFDEVPPLSTLIGSVVIFAGVVMPTWSRSRLKLQPGGPPMRQLSEGLDKR